MRWLLVCALVGCGGSVTAPPTQDPNPEPAPSAPAPAPEQPVSTAPRDAGRMCPWVCTSPVCWLETCNGQIVCNDKPDGAPVCQ